MNKTIFVPFIKSEEYLSQLNINYIIYARGVSTFQNNCFLFNHFKKQNLETKDITYLKNKNFKLCYIYDMFDFENREFTIEGYTQIRKDIDNIIALGFSYILVSNPYIIEILCNEYSNEIHIVISSQLEINSVRGKIFFDVLNDISSIKYLIVSHNKLNKESLLDIINSFKHIEIVLEIDRISSNNQIIHEHYYNIMYGYYNKKVPSYLKQFINENKSYFKEPTELFYDIKNLSYKVGELGGDFKNTLHNVNCLNNMKINEIKMIDFYLWI